MRYLVVYDVSDTKKRTKLYKLLSSYGTRVQFSCFEIETDAIKSLEDKIAQIIDRDTDKVFIFPISRYAISMITKLGIVKKLDESTVI